jgi:hypothetical protein
MFLIKFVDLVTFGLLNFINLIIIKHTDFIEFIDPLNLIEIPSKLFTILFRRVKFTESIKTFVQPRPKFLASKLPARY